MKRYDYVVIGGGIAAVDFAKKIAATGYSIALLENYSLGGSYLHSSELPSAISSSILQSFNVLGESEPVDFLKTSKLVQQRVAQAQKTTYTDRALEKLGVEVIYGDFSFTSSHSLESTNGKIIGFSKCLIAKELTTQYVQAISSKNVSFVTAENIWNHKKKPSEVVIVGLGVDDIAIMQTLKNSGANVTLLIEGEDLLSGFNKKINSCLATLLADITIIFNVLELSVQNTNKKIITFRHGQSTHELEYDLLYLGAVAKNLDSSDLGLSTADVNTDSNGEVITDALNRTTNKDIYSIPAGPINSSSYHRLAHTKLITEHCLSRNRTKSFTELLPLVVNSYPQICAIGEIVISSDAPSDSVAKITERTYSSPETNVVQHCPAVLKVYESNGTTLGVIVISPQALFIINYIRLLISGKITLDDLSAMIVLPSESLYLLSEFAEKHTKIPKIKLEKLRNTLKRV